MTIQAFLDRRGYVGVVDTQQRKHTVAVSAIGALQATGPRVTFMKIRGYQNLFVNVPVDEVQAAIKQAKALRKAQSVQQWQLALDFGGTGE